MKRCIFCGLPSDIGMFVTTKDGRDFHFECGRRFLETMKKPENSHWISNKEKRGNR